MELNEESKKRFNLFLLVVWLLGMSVVAGGCGLFMYGLFWVLEIVK